MNKRKASRIINELFYWVGLTWISLGIASVLFGSTYGILKVIIDLIYC